MSGVVLTAWLLVSGVGCVRDVALVEADPVCGSDAVSVISTSPQPRVSALVPWKDGYALFYQDGTSLWLQPLDSAGVPTESRRRALGDDDRFDELVVRQSPDGLRMWFRQNVDGRPQLFTALVREDGAGTVDENQRTTGNPGNRTPTVAVQGSAEWVSWSAMRGLRVGRHTDALQVPIELVVEADSPEPIGMGWGADPDAFTLLARDGESLAWYDRVNVNREPWMRWEVGPGLRGPATRAALDVNGGRALVWSDGSALWVADVPAGVPDLEMATQYELESPPIDLSVSTRAGRRDTAWVTEDGRALLWLSAASPTQLLAGDAERLEVASLPDGALVAVQRSATVELYRRCDEP